jgi:hypothetical protein
MFNFDSDNGWLSNSFPNAFPVRPNKEGEAEGKEIGPRVEPKSFRKGCPDLVAEGLNYGAEGGVHGRFKLGSGRTFFILGTLNLTVFVRVPAPGSSTLVDGLEGTFTSEFF